MRGIVWGATQEIANDKLTNIISDYVKYYGENIIEKVSCSKYGYWVCFTNGDYWRAIKCNEASCGQRCNISYVDRKINKALVNCIIKPCTTGYPYHAIQYYG